MNWKIKKSDNNIIVVENEKIRYTLSIRGFGIEYINQDTKRTLLGLYDPFETSRKIINRHKLSRLFNGIENGDISMDSFRWLNTWVVTNGATWGKGSKVANEISNTLFGLNRSNLPRLHGEENGVKFWHTDEEIYSILSEIINREFKKE